MGMGFAFIVPRDVSDRVVEVINQGENYAQVVGEVRRLKKSEFRLVTTLHQPYEGPSLDFVGYNN